MARLRNGDGLGLLERYRASIARLAEICRNLEGNPFPAELARIDAGETIHSVHGWELGLADVDGFYDLEPDGAAVRTLPTPAASSYPAGVDLTTLSSRPPVESGIDNR